MLLGLNAKTHNKGEQSQYLAGSRPLFELEEKTSWYIKQACKEGKEDVNIMYSHLKDTMIQRGLVCNVRKSTQRTRKQPN